MIQTVSILVQNIEAFESLTVFLGSPLVNELIDLNCKFDDEMIDYFISMLKTLVLRLQKMPQLINLFYNSHLKIFPLFNQA
jgi:hypothetical protein